MRGELNAGNVARRMRQETTLNLAAELQLALHPLLLHDLQMHRGVLHGDGHVIGDAFEKIEIAATERSIVLVEKLQHADDFLIAIANRNAQHRSGAES